MVARQTRPRRPAAKRRTAKRPRASRGTRGGRTRRTSTGRGGCPIVVIGASAGGLQAFKRFLAAAPHDGGLGFVLIPHLDPKHESLMVDLLSRQTTMPVVEATDGAAIEANRVYVIPPNRYLEFQEGRIRLSEPSEPRGQQLAIDYALRSLARDQQERAIGIILSGTGSHGTQGLAEIKLVGGMVMAQDPESAEFDQMPANAIATGLVDFVLSPEEMPAALLQYVAHPYVQRHGAAEGVAGTRGDEFQAILALLRARTRHDFRPYRKAMLARRILRRMGLAHLDSYHDYIAFLRGRPSELDALYKDLLIGVTSFFRDREAFELLAEHVIPSLVSRTGPDRAARIWVPGCATGEEAYSIAMLYLEQCAEAGVPANLQMFATDVDLRALETARKGVYPDTILAAVSRERLARYFFPVGHHHYQVNQQLREAVVFAPQNLLSDAPFSRLDLVSCRNLVMYLEPAIQQKVLKLFHFALNENGHLLLGTSEAIGRAVDLFESVSAKYRLYRRIGSARHEALDIPIVPVGPRALLTGPARRPATRTAPLTELMNQALVTAFAPAAVLISRRYEMLSTRGSLDAYLTFPSGDTTSDLIAVTRPDLRSTVRAACHRAVRLGEPVTSKDARVVRDGTHRRCTVTVRALTEPKPLEGLLLVTFQDIEAVSMPSEAARSEGPSDGASVVQQLERELTETREDLQSTIEELESSNEELKATNEDVMSMNEELQSTNEELETSKEELQSLNEEISTVNSQLQDKVDQLDEANADMANLLASSDVATIFLSPDLRILRFTPAIGRLLNVVAGDVGRPLQDFAPKFSDDSLQHDCRIVLEQATPIEKEIEAEDGRWYLRRIRPYRTSGNRLDGVVVTLFDITDRLARERERSTTARDQEESVRLRRMVENLPAGALYVGEEILVMNQAAQDITGYTPDEIRTRTEWFRLLHPDGLEEALAGYEAAADPAVPHPSQTSLRRKDGTDRIVELAIHRFDDHEVWLLHDITERTALAERMQAIIDAATDAIVSIDAHGVVDAFNAAAERLFGYAAAEVIGQNVKMLMPQPYRDEHDSYLVRYAATREPHVIGTSRELPARSKDGTIVPIELSVSEIGHRQGFTAILRDLTQRKEVDRRLAVARVEERQRLAHDLHDELGGDLTGVSLMINSLRSRLERDASPEATRVADIADQIEAAHVRLRQLSQGLRPVDAAPEGLLVALNALADQCEASSGIRCRVVSDPPVRLADPTVANELFDVAREAVHNAVRHGKPRHISITLATVDQRVSLTVDDDGLGFDPASMSGAGIGLSSMLQRASELGGTLSVRSARRKGTRVTCVIPYQPER